MPTKKAKAPPGPATYTFLIPQHVVKEMINVVDGQQLTHLFGRGNKQSDFSSFRITVGDTVIPFHIVDGRICPIARMLVKFKGTVGEWNKTAPIPDRIERHADVQLLVGDGGTPMHFNRPLAVDVVRALRYDAAKAPRPLKLRDDGRLAQATGVDGCFRLTPESADELVALGWI